MKFGKRLLEQPVLFMPSRKNDFSTRILIKMKEKFAKSDAPALQNKVTLYLEE
ncbi:hypothetical protein I6N90_14595 [Paenibacillus sp. GSMTC-2017]|nr:hypothetical protein [Paenibacillus sp. GSMTC-2017]